MSLVFPEALLNQMVAHCRSVAPLEGCGILGLKGGLEGDRVVGIWPIRNVSADAHGYELDPIEQWDVSRELEARGLTLATFHSHVARPAYPSLVDISRSVPDVLYVIVGVTDGEVRAFYLDSQVSEIEVDIRESLLEKRLKRARYRQGDEYDRSGEDGTDHGDHGHTSGH